MLRSDSRSEQGGDKLRVALWGEAFASVNPISFDDPALVSEDQPHKAEPLGGLMALLGALYEESVEAVVVRGGLVGYASMLSSPYIYVPYDILVPGILTVGDLSDVAAALAPRSLRLEGLVDGRNRVVSMPELRRWLEPTLEAYESSACRLLMKTDLTDDVAPWLSAALEDS